MIEFKNVPYRRWRRGRTGGWRLVTTSMSRKIMSIMGKAVKAGDKVEMNVRVVADSRETPPEIPRGRGSKNTLVYDVIDLEIRK